MDIVLDANVYRQDFSMRGTQFQELFAYLRRTSCSLVVPGVVLLEAKSNYRQFLSSTLHRLAREWGSLRRSAITEIDELRAPIDLEREVHLYANRLMEPAPNVKVRLWDDYSGVDVEEVVRRGVERVKPANRSGEELRDVILWLMAIRYASQAPCPVALISDDDDFQGPDGGLHETLVADLAQARVEIALYKGIREFIKENSLETEELDEEQFMSLISSGLLEGEAQKSLKQTRELLGLVQQATIQSLRFSSGKKYKVGEDSFYVEGLMSGTGTLRVQEYQYNVQVSEQLIEAPSSAVPVNYGPAAQFRQVFSAVSSATDPGRSRAFMYGWSRPTYPLSAVRYAPPAYLAPSFFYPEYAPPQTIEREYSCRFELEVSARTEAGRLDALQIDNLRLAEMKLLSDSPSASFREGGGK